MHRIDVPILAPYGKNLHLHLFVGKVNSADDYLRYYRTATILSAPSSGSESFGIILSEAVAAGLPSMATEGRRTARQYDWKVVTPRILDYY